MSAMFDGVEIYKRWNSRKKPDLTEEQKERFEKIQKELIEIANKPNED